MMVRCFRCWWYSDLGGGDDSDCNSSSYDKEKFIACLVVLFVMLVVVGV